MEQDCKKRCFLFWAYISTLLFKIKMPEINEQADQQILIIMSKISLFLQCYNTIFWLIFQEL